jgi:hypothetical protein
MMNAWRLTSQHLYNYGNSRRAVPMLLAGGVWHHSTLKTGNNLAQAEGSSDNEGDDRGQRLFDAKQFTEQWKSINDFFDSQVKNDSSSSSPDFQSKEKKDSSGQGIFGFLKALTTDQGSGSNDQEAKEAKDAERKLQDVQSSLLSLLTGRMSSQSAVEELVAKARHSTEQGDVSDSVSMEELLTILRQVGDEMGKTFEKHLGGRELPPIYPTNLYYFLEAEDEVKNFSWRRRKHRFCKGINVENVEELNSHAKIAKIGYDDDMKSIKKAMSETFGYEVIYCQMDSLPGQPSHFLAVRKGQSSWSSSLDMLLCVRGTKTITDVITDLLADTVDYRGGKAHSGILQSGRFLAEKHLDTFEEFLKVSGKKKINLTIVGHSLGAGAASIAGMELQGRNNFDVHVFGFGCPALVSKDLSESAQSYITTVVGDNDCIPRMSLATMINAVLSIGEYNWVPKAKQDIEDLIDQVQIALPGIITGGVKNRLLEMLNSNLLSTIQIPTTTQERIEPILFPRKSIRR